MNREKGRLCKREWRVCLTQQKKLKKKDIALFAVCWLGYFFCLFWPYELFGLYGGYYCGGRLFERDGGSGWYRAVHHLRAGADFLAAFGRLCSARKMIVVGLIGSSLSNLFMCLAPNLNFMIVAWCVNGFMQSLLWSPIVRLFAQYFTSQVRGTLGVYINSTVPVGTLATYGFTALILEMTGNWKLVFSALLLL